MTTISSHKNSIAASFSDVADSYEEWAGPQRRMAQRLVQLLPERLPSGPVVDACCGTGVLTELLLGHYPETGITGIDIASGMIEVCRRRWKNMPTLSFVMADVESDFSVESCALIASNCGFQWFQSPAETVTRLTDALAPGGFLATSVPVEGSLPELCESYKAATGQPLRGIEFLSGTRYVEMLEAAGLHCRNAVTEIVRTDYNSAWDALRSFKHTGTTFRHHEGYTPLPAHLTRRLADHYEKTFAGPDGRVPVTYQTLYIVAEART